MALDDEASALTVVDALMSDRPGYVCAGLFTQPDDAREAITERVPDLLFLDVEMPGLSGLAFLESLSVRPVTLLVTAHAQYAVNAFALGVREYVLKPMSAKRLDTALDNLEPLLDARDPESSAPASRVLSFRDGHSRTLIAPADVVHIRAEGNFSAFAMRQGREMLVSEPLSELERRLAGFGFVRIHRSYLANLTYVQAFRSRALRMRRGPDLPVGRTYRDGLAPYAG